MDTSKLFRVDGIVAVITGGGTGIGFVMAKALAGAGARKVYILGRRREVLETAATAHSTIVPIQCDVTDKASLQSAVDYVTKDTGYINLFIANSGIFGPFKFWNSDLSIPELRKDLFEDASVEGFTQALHTNITGTFFSILAFLELLDEGNKQAVKGEFGAPETRGSDVPSIQSQVIITCSLSGLVRVQISAPAYGASKSALIHLTKHTSTNLMRHGIRVNALAPGVFPSDMTNAFIATIDFSKIAWDENAFIPARRAGSDVEMAGSILYLASRAGSYCNGFILVNDGGKISTLPSTY